ncbi:uncharacterized protein PV09_06842 [Verruconis gallopava]|uniref:Ubiquitin-like domain-containing protein n=1 Tax=Verruconis gallopava TaxID=253628 RepID=A0A0D1YLF4_9PEZI|nr:uncharacterized protein PV09_06842 [Verruconis gallopava]KIW01657.1 hypothetical protein PV09_06842 [Verruconis gallopava]
MKPGGFFKKPDWLKNKPKAETKPEETADATQMFAWSVGTVSDALAEQKRKEKLRAQKKQEASREESASPSTKRRKLSEKVNYDHDREAKNDSIPQHQNRVTRKSLESSPRSLSHRDKATLSSLCKEDAKVIVLSDSSDVDRESSPSPTPKSMSTNCRAKDVSEDSQKEDEDDEFAELAAAARARAKQQEVTLQSSATNTVSSGLDANLKSLATDTEPNPTIDILVWSPLEGAKPLVVKRKWNQNFRDIRKAWLARQLDLASHIKKEDIYFTWRNKRVFDISSCKSIGVKLDAHGEAIIPSDQGRYRAIDGKISLCATTDAQQKLEKEKAEEKHLRESEEAAEMETEPDQESRSTGIRIILRSKGYPDQKLIVKPDTTVERLQGAFRTANKISETSNVVLVIDGDELTPDMTMEDAEVEDLNMIEVYVR